MILKKQFQWKRKHILDFAKTLEEKIENGEAVDTSLLDYLDVCLNIRLKGRPKVTI